MVEQKDQRPPKALRNAEKRNVTGGEFVPPTDLDGTPRTFRAVLTTGGPQIEVDVTNGVVRGFHGSDYHATHVDDENGILETLDFRYRNDWNANVNTDDKR